MWWGEHVDLLEHINVIKGWECWEDWELYPNNNMVTWPPHAAIENLRPPMQKPFM